MFANLFTPNQFVRSLSATVMRTIAMFQLWFEERRLFKRILACFSTYNVLSYKERVNAAKSRHKKLISFFFCIQLRNYFFCFGPLEQLMKLELSPCWWNNFRFMEKVVATVFYTWHYITDQHCKALLLYQNDEKARQSSEKL